MQLKHFLFLNLFLLTFSLFGQSQFTLSGTVTDGENGETLIGATVLEPISGEGTVTNEYGFYSLTLPAGAEVTVYFSYVGYTAVEKTVALTQDVSLNVELGTGIELEEVVVKANSFEEQLQSTEMSVETISTKEAKLVPVLLGESDILKTIQLKPGIPSGSEGSTGLYVRGGASDQNLIVLDEAIVYNPSHLFGFFSTFNTDAVKDLKLYKGGFPSQYGGRLSSVIDVKLKEGNKKEFAGTGGIGLISSRLTLEGPIQKDESSFIVSGRRTYFDLITNQINNANADNPDATLIPAYYFYDLNTKVNFKLSEKDRLYLSGYFGRDVFGFNSDAFDFTFDWGNITGTARWNHQFNPRLFANTTFTFSDYQYNIKNEVQGFSFNVGSDITDATVKSDFYFNLNNDHTLRFGASVIYHQFGVGRLKAGSDDGSIDFNAGQDFDAVEYGAYVGDEWTVNDKLKVNGGLRFSGFNNDGATYANIEPRIASKYSVNNKLSIKASYARMNQYLHLIANGGISLPTDVWYPSTEKIAPQRSDQVAAGFSYLLGGNYFITNEYFYKKLGNQVEFVDWADLFANDNLEDEFAIGEGEGYGVEIAIEKKKGKLKGWVGYTLSRVVRSNFTTVDPGKTFTGANGQFSPRYDRRHDISIVAFYEFNKRWTASAAWVYGSGDLAWLPPGRIDFFQDVPGGNALTFLPVYGSERNNFRLPAYHRLDLGIVYKMFPKWGESDITLSVVNAYDRRNAFFITIEPETGDPVEGLPIQPPTGLKANQVSLFPILPSLTWNFKF